MSKQDIAVIGLACRFPGDANSPAAFWDALISGKDAVSEIPADRFDQRVFRHPDPKAPGRSYTFQAGTLGDVSRFDAAFFGIAPREAEQMDPQQRFLLEMTWEALESGGQIPSHLAGTDCAVYVGISATDFGNVRSADPASINAYFMLGSSLSIAANRLSYAFDLHGPSMAVDTACSSSIVALHEAVHAIRSGRASMAVVGGIHMLLSPYNFIGFSRAGMLSPYGRCRAFDKNAKGYVRAEGGGVVVLKPLDAALRDHDPIRAVIRGIGINSDGRTHGIALPSSEAQEALLRRVYSEAKVDPADLIYFEAHGTGTAVGDPAEAGAIGRALGVKRAKGHPLPIGSVKSNLGHLEPASGMAGLIKGLLVLQHHQIPPSIHCDEPNPEIDFAGLNIEVARQPVELTRGDKPALVGINSFGFGGTNAHVILQEFRPAAQERRRGTATPPLFLSARSEPALKAAARQLADTLQNGSAESYFDVAYTLARRRAHMEHRLVCRSEEPAAAAAALHAYAGRSTTESGETLPITNGAVIANEAKVAFVFSGNGSQWAGMGVALLEDAAFRKTVEGVDRLIRAKAGWSVLAELKRPAAESRIADTRYAQPMLFAVQIGMVDALAARGLKPEAVTGHSVGEVSAAYTAGALSLEQAVNVILERSAAQGRTRGDGLMAAVDLDVERAAAAIAPYAEKIEIAAINSPQAVTLSGEGGALRELGEKLSNAGVNFRMLDIDYAFHSRLLDPIESGLRAALAALEATAAAIPFYSTVTGTLEGGNGLNADYWWRNARQAVRFSDAVGAMANDGYRLFVEVGPHPIMQGYLRQTLRSLQLPGQAVFTMSRDRANVAQLDATADTAYVLGAELDWSVHFPRNGRHVDLPTYPWQRESYWSRPTREAQGGIMTRIVHPFLGASPGANIWEAQIDATLFPFLADHVVGGSIVFPAAGFIEAALAAARACFGEGPCDIEDFQISRPLVLEKETKVLRLAFDADDGAFTIESRPRLSDGDWSRHATGRLARGTGTPAAKEAAPMGGAPVDIASHYADALAIGLEYGRHFQTLRGMSINGRDAVAEVALATDTVGAVDRFILHPALLDACFQALLSLARSHAPAGDDAATFLPYRLDRFRLFRAGTAARCHVRLETISPRSLVATFRVFDGDGEVLAEIDGFRFQQATLNARRSEERYFHTVALPLPLLRPVDLPEVPIPEAPVTVLDAAGWSTSLADRLAAQFAGSAMRAGGVVDSISYDRAGGRLDPMARGRLEAALSLASQNGLIDRRPNGSWHLKALDTDPAVEWRIALEKFPKALAEITLIAEAGTRLAGLLRGIAGAGKASAAMLEHLSLASPSIGELRNAGIEAIRHALGGLPSWHRPNVLVVTAGGPAVREHFIAELKRDDLDLTIASIDNLEGGDARDDPGVRVAAFKAGSAEPISPAPDRPYDILLADDLLRQGVAPAAAMHGLTNICRDRALVLFTDVTAAPWVAFCLDNGQVASTDWQSAAAGAGLDVVRADAIGGGRLLTARCRNGTAQRVAEPDPAIGSGPWLILADDAGFEAAMANALDSALARLGKRSLRVLPAGPQHTLEDDLAVAVNDVEFWSLLLQELAAMDLAPAGLIHLQGLTEEALPGADRCRPILAFLQAQDRIPGAAPLTLALITAGAHELVSDPHDVANPLFVRGSGALWGLGRVLQNEKSELRCRMIDLQFGRDDSAHDRYADAIAAEILASAGEPEVVLTKRGRFGLRTRAWHSRGTLRPDGETAIKLTFTPGSLERLAWRPLARRAPRDGEVEIEVVATGLNFRDVMFAMGVLPDEAVERGFAGATLGLEASGRVVRVGVGAGRFKVGDAVMCFAPACFASHVTVTERAVMAKPEQIGFEEAATIPTAYFTVYYALKYAGQIRPRQRILIHGAAGAVGLAAIRYALHLGAEVFATAGNDEKRMVVELSGVSPERIFDSRTLAFADQILAMTGGEGVDLVLNSLAGEAIQKNLAILKPFGKLLELGKRDFFANTRIGLRPFRNNVSFHGIDVDQLMVDRPELAAELFAELSDLIQSGVFTPLPYRRFQSSQVVSAFRHLQQSRHVGKVVISAPPAALRDHAGIDAAAQLWLDPDAHYLVTGGLSGFGFATAKWLVAHGARHLVLVGRRGMSTPGAAENVATLEKLGATVDARALDVGEASAVRRLIVELDASPYPLRGVFHAAAVFDDGIVDTMTHDRFARVVAPKALGAHALDSALGERKLDHFVLFSSISALFGNPGQANYVAANMEMESLALHRRHRGLAAVAVCFPPIEDAGYLVRNKDIGDLLRDRLGVKTVTAEAALRELEHLLISADAPPVVAAVEVDWRAAGRIVPALKTARFREVFNPKAGADRSGDALDITALAATLSPTEWVELIAGMIVEIVAEVLRSPVAGIDRNKPIFDLGMDLLMLVELKLLIDERLGVDIPQMSLTESATINRIAERVASSLKDRAAITKGVTEIAQTAISLAAQHSESIGPDAIANAVKDVTIGNVRSRLVT